MSKLDGWQLSGRITTRAARRVLSSRQYGLWVKCGPAGMQARAVGGKMGGAGSPPNNVAWAEANLRTKWYPDPSSRLAIIDIGREVGRHIFNHQKFYGGHSPQTFSAICRPLWPKNYRLEI